MSKRRLLHLLLLPLVPFLVLAEPAHAYLDPGSGSMLLTLIMGGIAGMGVAARLYWRRMIGFFTGKKVGEGDQGAD